MGSVAMKKNDTPRMTDLYLLIPLIFLLLITSCNVVKEQPRKVTVRDKTKAYVYECGDKFSFAAKFSDEKVLLKLPDRTVSLPHVKSASGALYSDGKIVYWNQGEEARLELGQTIFNNCRYNHAKSIWQTAKLKGVDFRAVGNNPLWFLEISDFSRTVFSKEQSREKYIFNTPEPVIDFRANKTIYQTRSNEHALEVMLLRKSCHDSVSGDIFQTSVFVGMDGIGYQGCGRSLN